MKLWKVVAGLAILSFVLVTSPGCARVLGPGPEEVTRQWYQAVGEFDAARMYELTHPERQAALEAALRDPLITVSAAVGLQKRQYFEMRYTVVFDDGQTARVHVAGKVANRLGIIDTVDETVELRKFEGRWLVWSAGGWFQEGE